MRAGLVFNQKKLLLGLLFAFYLVPVAVQAQLDDPTRPPGHRLVLPGGEKASSTAAITYTLSSVFISPMRRSAIVNDRSVELGDIINGAKVVEIYPSAVKLKKQGKIFTIRLVSQVIKKSRIH